MLRHNAHLCQEAIHCFKHSRQSWSVVEFENEEPSPPSVLKLVHIDGLLSVESEMCF